MNICVCVCVKERAGAWLEAEILFCANGGVQVAVNSILNTDFLGRQALPSWKIGTTQSSFFPFGFMLN